MIQPSRVSWASRWYERGTFGEWFAWIEALGLTAALITGTIKVQEPILKLPIGVLAVASTIFVFFWGLIGVSTFVGSLVRLYNVPKVLHWPIAAVGSVLITPGVLWSLVSALLALTGGGV